jgi:hypothetical protein
MDHCHRSGKGWPDPGRYRAQAAGEDIVAKGGKEQARALEQLSADLDIGSSTRFRIDPETGVVQWMQLVQRRRIGDRNDVRTTTLSLRPEPYVPKATTATPASGG